MGPNLLFSQSRPTKTVGYHPSFHVQGRYWIHVWLTLKRADPFEQSQIKAGGWSAASKSFPNLDLSNIPPDAVDQLGAKPGSDMPVGLP